MNHFVELILKYLSLLRAACATVKKGGTVVYSTCSLSPLQNDGVVHMAMKELRGQHKIDVVAVDTSPFRHIFESVYRFHQNPDLTYGQVILPHIARNFGPMYFAKLRRIS